MNGRPPDGARVLVTGGAGFIGVPVVRRLLEAGWRVAVLDNFNRRGAEALGSAGSDIEIMEVDLRDPAGVMGAVVEWRPACCVHLAALHFIPYCLAHPSETLAVNVLGTQHVLDALSDLRQPVPVLFTSTADVYQPDLAPHHESSPVGPDNVYGLSKYTGERLVAQYSLRTGAPAVIVRLFNVYGPGETNPHLVPTIIEQLHLGNRIRLGNLDARRDYVFVEDVADALASLSVSPPAGLVMNVGTGQSHSAHRILEQLGALTGRPIEVDPDPARMRPSDRPNLQADISLLQRTLPNLSPVGLEEGLRRLVAAEGLAEAAAGERASKRSPT